jgi:hypothetical protein
MRRQVVAEVEAQEAEMQRPLLAVGKIPVASRGFKKMGRRTERKPP